MVVKLAAGFQACDLQTPFLSYLKLMESCLQHISTCPSNRWFSRWRFATHSLCVHKLKLVHHKFLTHLLFDGFDLFAGMPPAKDTVSSKDVPVAEIPQHAHRHSHEKKKSELSSEQQVRVAILTVSDTVAAGAGPDRRWIMLWSPTIQIIATC